MQTKHACMISCFSHVRPCATLWTVAHQAPLSMGFSRQEFWNVISCPTPGDLPNPRIKLESPALQADSLTAEPPGKPSRQITSPLNFSPFMWKVEKAAPHS